MIKMESVGSRERFLIKKFLPCITGFVLVAAIFFIGAGAWAVDKEKAHAAISSLPILTPPILLVTAGILCLLVGFVGLFSVCKKETNLRNMGNALKVFLVLLALASILALVAGGFGMDYAGRLSDGYKADFYKKIEKYATTGHYEILAHVDRVQKEDACCGVINYADWRNTQYAGNRYDKVPDSCCQVEEHACGFEFELSKINQKGCFMAGVDQMNTKLKIVGVGGLVLGVFEAILWISLFCIYFKETCCPNQGKDRIEVSYRKTGESEHPSERENEGCSSDTQTKDKPSSTQAHEGPGAQESHSPSRNQGKDRIEVSYRKTGESEHPSERENEGCSSDAQTKDTPSSTQGYKGPGAQVSHSPSPQDDAPSSVTPSVGKAPKRSGKRKKASRKSTSQE